MLYSGIRQINTLFCVRGYLCHFVGQTLEILMYIYLAGEFKVCVPKNLDKLLFVDTRAVSKGGESMASTVWRQVRHLTQMIFDIGANKSEIKH